MPRKGQKGKKSSSKRPKQRKQRKQRKTTVISTRKSIPWRKLAGAGAGAVAYYIVQRQRQQQQRRRRVAESAAKRKRQQQRKKSLVRGAGVLFAGGGLAAAYALRPSKKARPKSFEMVPARSLHFKKSSPKKSKSLPGFIPAGTYQRRDGFDEEGNRIIYFFDEKSGALYLTELTGKFFNIRPREGDIYEVPKNTIRGMYVVRRKISSAKRLEEEYYT